MTKLTKEADIRRAKTIVWLMSEFPQVFGDEPVPLAIGIHKDILANKPAEISRDDLKRALHYWVTLPTYRAKLKIGAWRYDLTGHRKGIVEMVTYSESEQS
jgi:sRNA-binding protein